MGRILYFRTKLETLLDPYLGDLKADVTTIGKAIVVGSMPDLEVDGGILCQINQTPMIKAEGMLRDSLIKYGWTVRIENVGKINIDPVLSLLYAEFEPDIKMTGAIQPSVMNNEAYIFLIVESETVINS